MKTTKRQLANFAIRIVREIARSLKNIGIDYYSRQNISVWFYNKDSEVLKHFSLYGFTSIRENIKIFRQIIKEVRR